MGTVLMNLYRLKTSCIGAFTWISGGGPQDGDVVEIPDSTASYHEHPRDHMIFKGEYALPKGAVFYVSLACVLCMLLLCGYLVADALLSGLARFWFICLFTVVTIVSTILIALHDIPSMGGRFGMIRILFSGHPGIPATSLMIGGRRVIFVGWFGRGEKKRGMDLLLKDGTDPWPTISCESCARQFRRLGDYFVCRKTLIDAAERGRGVSY